MHLKRCRLHYKRLDGWQTGKNPARTERTHQAHLSGGKAGTDGMSCARVDLSILVSMMRAKQAETGNYS